MTTDVANLETGGYRPMGVASTGAFKLNCLPVTADRLIHYVLGLSMRIISIKTRSRCQCNRFATVLFITLQSMVFYCDLLCKHDICCIIYPSSCERDPSSIALPEVSYFSPLFTKRFL